LLASFGPLTRCSGQVINSYGVLQGGFIWDWVDQGLSLPPNSPKATAAAKRAARRLLPPKKAAWQGGTGRDDALDEFRKVARRPEQPIWGYGGDYGPQYTPSDENFCINGLLQVNLNPKP
jgi:beta-galactosidase